MRCVCIDTQTWEGAHTYIRLPFPATEPHPFLHVSTEVLPSSLELECLLLFPLVTLVPTLHVPNPPYQFSLSPTLDCVAWPPHQKSHSAALAAYWSRRKWLFAEGIAVGLSASVQEPRVSPKWWRDPLTWHPWSSWALSFARLTASLSSLWC